MPRLVPLLRAVYQLAGLFLVVLAIPIAFDIGGESCGISFTFMLSVFYFVLCTMRLMFKNTVIRPLTSLLYYSQFVTVPSLLLLHLSKCQSNPSLDKIMWPWSTGLHYSTGLFALLEGFCSLIVIQACGNWAAKATRKSDFLFFIILVLASIMITADFYLLLRIYWLPEILGVDTATLIGSALTLCVGIGVYGIWCRKGSVVESTLLFSYVVYQIYLSFTDFKSNLSIELDSVTNTLWSIFWFNEDKAREAPAWTSHLLNLNETAISPVIIESYTEFMTRIAELTPAGLKTMVEFVKATLNSIIPSIGVSLFVRLASYFIAMRLVPYIRKQTPHRSFKSQPRRSRWLLLMYSYSPILIIAVYTHLLLQHFGHIVHVAPDAPSVPSLDFRKIWSNSRQAWQFWGWANVFMVLGIYGIELTIAPEVSNDVPGEINSDREEFLEM